MAGPLGHPILEVRLRYEDVDQAGFANNASATTVRARYGWETGTWRGFKALVEGETVGRVGAYDFNDQVHPNPAYPVVADPNGTELNRLQLSWTASPALTATLGRQRLVQDDQRFLGAAAFRQDDQTFDAVAMAGTVGSLTYTGGYLWRINRAFAQAQDWQSDSWYANATWAVSAAFKPQAFVYALEFDNAATQSSLTWGLRATGRIRPGPWTLAYSGTFARQTDYRNNPANFDLNFWQAEASATYGVATVRLDHEVFQGNGARGFSTPLATLHAFQGWADAFLTTPANGIRDTNLGLVLRPTWRLGPMREVELTLRGHSFHADRTGQDLGSEIDAMAQVRFTAQLVGQAIYADFEGAPGFSQRRKLWVGLEYRY